MDRGEVVMLGTRETFDADAVRRHMTVWNPRNAGSCFLVILSEAKDLMAAAMRSFASLRMTEAPARPAPAGPAARRSA
jgi:hypothetical protein